MGGRRNYLEGNVRGKIIKLIKENIDKYVFNFKMREKKILKFLKL